MEVTEFPPSPSASDQSGYGAISTMSALCHLPLFVVRSRSLPPLKPHKSRSGDNASVPVKCQFVYGWTARNGRFYFVMVFAIRKLSLKAEFDINTFCETFSSAYSHQVNDRTLVHCVIHDDPMVYLVQTNREKVCIKQPSLNKIQLFLNKNFHFTIKSSKILDKSDMLTSTSITILKI